MKTGYVSECKTYKRTAFGRQETDCRGTAGSCHARCKGRGSCSSRRSTQCRCPNQGRTNSNVRVSQVLPIELEIRAFRELALLGVMHDFAHRESVIDEVAYGTVFTDLVQLPLMVGFIREHMENTVTSTLRKVTAGAFRRESHAADED